MGQLLRELGLEESFDKASAPSTSMFFLGVQFDTVACTLSVTPDRLTDLQELLDRWAEKTSTTKKDLQSLLGKLNLMARLLSFLRSVVDEENTVLTVEFQKDIRWWRQILPLYNGVSMMPFCRLG